MDTEPTPPVAPSPDQQSELQQLRAEIAEMKQVLLQIRRSQRWATWMGVIKVLVYVGLVGAAAVALRGVLGSGLGALTGGGLYGQLSSSTSPTGLNFNELMKSVQQLQNGQ
jgi:hypothetical protein